MDITIQYFLNLRGCQLSVEGERPRPQEWQSSGTLLSEIPKTHWAGRKIEVRTIRRSVMRWLSTRLHIWDPHFFLEDTYDTVDFLDFYFGGLVRSYTSLELEDESTKRQLTQNRWKNMLIGRSREGGRDQNRKWSKGQERRRGDEVFEIKVATKPNLSVDIPSGW